MSFGEIIDSTGLTLGPTLILIKKQDSKSNSSRPSGFVYRLKPDDEASYMAGVLEFDDTIESNLRLII